VYDDATMDATINGQKLPMADPLALVKGREFTFIYDRDGHIVDFTSDLPAQMSDTLKPMLSSMLGATGPLTLAVGETVTRPITVPLPLPGVGSRTIGYETRFTLNSVTSEGGARVAHLTTAMTGRTAQPLATPDAAAPPAAMDMRIEGTGSMDVDIDRGVVRSGQTDMTFDAGLTGAGAPGRTASPLRIRGTMKMTQTTER